ncbi:PREDICTED: ERI1 exoribonuclease 3-like [Priapulus caudatus]|uniref:ERI1 exoribonuclease 3-like n=1 Tax=Priapulus caudatus TaxID=37621 RepID=A0ABM1F426_PRICU|nr:PREDICTED: ERI1 exoribonuclease 3-like [Priapulus caudatus]
MAPLIREHGRERDIEMLKTCIVSASHMRCSSLLRKMCTIRRQPFDYFLVLDFEATCVERTKIQPVQLTGIIQDMIDNEPDLEQTLQTFDDWLRKEGVGSHNFCFVTYGDWDLNTMLPTQCAYFHISAPAYYNQWINIKQAVSEVTGVWPKGMMSALQVLNIRHEGRHHSGIDDCKNLARMLQLLALEGAVFTPTSDSLR